MRLQYASGSADITDTHHLLMSREECSALRELLRSVDMDELTELYVDRMTTNKSEPADRDEIKGLLNQYQALILAHTRALVILNSY